ncbi:mitochondrial thiamine pyrophosphate carrier-like [Macrosteles quadrilineatus]|uniref:mitochondrial thiamine pyrophosphate carrier-like n=1 Tax=Macrosteles quadrilineatus TaxID=74068 RepID=UPI0023E1ABE4|nr:mitochondrial thiamine pyrophosphate carrier-like [Macrosteles quadrilineatus]
MSHSEKDTNVPRYIPLLAGGFSGVATRFICQPLDVLKIRFQLQVEPIAKSGVESKYKSIPQATRLIILEEGVGALWKGHVPAQFLSLTYGMIQFGVYNGLVKESKSYPLLADNKSKVEFVCGFTSGCLATIFSFPFDIVRTRLIIQGNNKVYKNMFHGLNHIYKHEGVRGWFKGLSPTLLQIGPLSGLQFASYHFFKRLLKEFETKSNMTSKWFTVSETAVAGSMAGFTAKILVYPLDLFRKRLQFQGFQQARKGYGKNFTCSSLVTCVTETVRGERTVGLFKGLTPSLVKASIVNALIFTFYEEMYSYLLRLHQVPR